MGFLTGMKMEWTWIDNQEALERAIADIKKSSLIGIDTEYDSYRYFREKLCLIQISTLSNAYLFDPFESLDISFLGEIFSSYSIIKIAHACDNDIRILKREYNFEFRNIFDTHRAALMLGSRYLSLSSIIEEYLGIFLEKPKKLQRSKWYIRPLTIEQLTYAANDTSHLINLYHGLKKKLIARGLEEEANWVFSEMANVQWTEKTLNSKGHLKLEGSQELNTTQRKHLKVLYRWRFQKAKESNRAIFMILSDKSLIDLSRMENRSIESLVDCKILPPRKVKDYGREIIATLTSIE